MHYVAQNNLWYLPTWFSEGLAQFYESFEVVGEKVYIGLPCVRHLVALRGTIRIPLEQLFAVDHNSELYNESERKGMFYSQSWALVTTCSSATRSGANNSARTSIWLGTVNRETAHSPRPFLAVTTP